MNFIYLVASIITILIGIFTFIFSFKNFSESHLKRIHFSYLILSISFLIEAFLFFTASLDYIVLSIQDFYFIQLVLLLVRTAILVLIFSIIIGNKNLRYILTLYLILILVYLFSKNFYGPFFLSSYLILLLTFLISFSFEEFFKVSIIGIIYVVFSAIAFTFTLFYPKGMFILWVLSLILFSILVVRLWLEIIKNKIKIIKNKRVKKPQNFFIEFIRYFVFIILLTNFIFVGTVTTHELGHYSLANFFGCSSSRIVLEGSLPHTEILCQNEDPLTRLVPLIGGILIPILIALIFFFVGGKFITEMGLLVMGFNLIISYNDFLDLGLSSTVGLFLRLFGISIILSAVGLLASSRVDEKNFSYFTEGEKDFYREKNITNHGKI